MDGIGFRKNGLYGPNHNSVRACVSVCVRLGQWIVDDISYQKMYGVFGLTHDIVEISGDVTDAGRTDKGR